MNSPRTGKLWKWRTLLFVGGFLLAPTAPQVKADTTPPEPASSQNDAHKFLRAVLMRDFYQTSLDFKAENLNAEEVAARVEKVLLARKPSLPVRIEVRDVLPVRLNFAVRNSTVARVLNSAAILAGARLWIFEDYALLAPEKALTAEELSSLNDGFGVSWPLPSPTGRGRIERLRRKAIVSFIAEKISAINATDKEAAGIPVKQLSPDIQAMLQDLVNESNQIFTNELNRMSTPGEIYVFEPLEFSLNAKVRLSTNNKDLVELDFPTPQQNMNWPLDGERGGFSAGLRPRSKPTSSRPPLPLELSAGKS